MKTADHRFFSIALAALVLVVACSSETEMPPGPPPGPDASADATEDQKPDVSVDRSDEPTAEASPDRSPDTEDSAREATADRGDAIEELPCAPCPSGVCLDGSVCAECAEDKHCSGALPRCDTATNKCVACRPGGSDNCPAGQYCTSAFSCVPGCKGDSACASGICTINHDCEKCVNDRECAGGRVCGSGTCGATCNAPSDCTGGFDCCDHHCVDKTRDIGNCSACGAACNLAQFCGTAGCNTVSFANICEHAKTTSIQDTQTADIASNVVVQNALLAACAPPPSAASSAQGTPPGPTNAMTGQPVVGGNHLLTATGGKFVQDIVKYLESSGASPIRLDSSADEFIYYGRAAATDAGTEGGSSPGPIVASLAFNQWTPTHDIFVIELVRDPVSGTLVLVLFGQQAESTAAAAWYFANVILPNRATYTKSWYVYEWRGTSDAGPSGSDSFQLRASGP